MDMTRRRFLGNSASAVIVAGTMAQGKVFGANDRIRMGIVGMRSRGNAHMKSFNACGGVEIAALCEVDSAYRNQRAADCEQLTGRRPDTYADIRDMLADESIDAVSIATPNHWHVLGAVWGCQA